MVYLDTHSLSVPVNYVERVHMFDIPTSLREHAHCSLNDLSGDEWWTVGEFRYEDGADYETAVARRVMRSGRVTVEYGIEV